MKILDGLPDWSKSGLAGMTVGAGMSAGIDAVTTGHVNPLDVAIGAAAGATGSVAASRARARELAAIPDRQQVARLRMENGRVDPEALADLMATLPTVRVAGEVADSHSILVTLDEPTGSSAQRSALHRYAGQVLGLDPGETTLTRVGGEGLKGKSGAPVFFLEDATGQRVAVVKVFPRAEQFGRELSALDRLGDPELTSFDTPHVIAAAKLASGEGPLGVLVTDVAPGKGIDDLLLAVPRGGPADLTTVHESVEATATSLAQLHTQPVGTGGPVGRAYVEGYIHGTRESLAEVVARRSVYEPLGLDTTQLSNAINAAAERFSASPGGASLAHGDAHPGNFFFDPVDRKLTFIDVSTAHLSMGSDGQPIGCAARDFANFEQRLGHLSHDYVPEARVEMQQRFHDAYRAAGGAPLDPDGLTLFRSRAALHRLLKITPDGVPTKADALRIQGYVTLIKEAAGIGGIDS